LAIACAARTFDWDFAEVPGVAMLGASKAHSHYRGNLDLKIGALRGIGTKA